MLALCRESAGYKTREGKKADTVLERVISSRRQRRPLAGLISQPQESIMLEINHENLDTFFDTTSYLVMKALDEIWSRYRSE